MGKLRHIAMTVPDPWAAAEFYQKAFGMTKVGETDSSLARGVYLTDGVINLALLNYKTDAAAGEQGKAFVRLHHVGFWVDDIETTKTQIEETGRQYLISKVPVKSNIFYEIKFSDPNGVVLDISAAG